MREQFTEKTYVDKNELKEYLVNNLRFNIWANPYQRRIEFSLTIDEDDFENDKTKICEDWINFDDLRID